MPPCELHGGRRAPNGTPREPTFQEDLVAKTPKSRPLFTVRTAVVLLTALLLAVVAGGLTFAGTGNPPFAVLAAVSGFLGGTRWAHPVIE